MSKMRTLVVIRHVRKSDIQQWLVIFPGVLESDVVVVLEVDDDDDQS